MGIGHRSVENLTYGQTIDLLRESPAQVSLLVSQIASSDSIGKNKFLATMPFIAVRSIRPLLMTLI